MARTKRCRSLHGPPCCSKFKPAGIPAKFIEKINITLDEYESIRLADYLGMEHVEASQSLGISRSVFTRLVEGARKKVARALVEGCELVIQGGQYHFRNRYFRCMECYHFFPAETEEDPELCPECSSEKITSLNNNFENACKCGEGEKLCIHGK